MDRGRIIVGNVCAEGTFEIFPSGGAWDMLFGKPMLHTFDATHKYKGDMVTLNSEEGTETLENSNVELDAEWLQKTKVAVAQVSNLGERVDASPMRHRQVHDCESYCTADHALFSIEELDENNNIQAKQMAKKLKRKLQVKRRRERSARAAALWLLWMELKRTAVVGCQMLQRRVRHARGTRRNCERAKLRYWQNSPWDFGQKECGIHKEVDESESETIENSKVQVEFVGGAGAPNQRATVEDCTDDEAEGIQNTKVAVASASNPGVHDSATPLKPRHVSNPSKLDPSDRLAAQESNILSVEDVHQVLEDLAPGTEQPEIPIDTDNTIFTRLTEPGPFKSERVAEILRLVEIGEDLSPKERHSVEGVQWAHRS
jgi:hypothetical protein